VADQQTPVASRSSVGFAEVGIPGISANETIALPQDLLRAAGASSLQDRLSLVMTRLRSSGAPPRSDTETALNRTFWLPTARTFSLTGSARISALIPDDQIDLLVGRTSLSQPHVVATSLGRLPGDLQATAMATLDGSSSTLWEPGFGVAHQAGQWLQYTLPKPVTFGHLDLQVAADSQHSVPTKVTVSADSGSATVSLPVLADSPVPGSVTDVPISFPTLTGQTIRITVDTVRIQDTPNYYSDSPIAMPLGIAEVGIPGVVAPPVPSDIPSSCQGNLMTMDGNPLWVQISGSTATALARQALTISLCGPDAGGLTLAPGDHTLRSVLGQVSGFDIDQLALDSAPGGGVMPLASPTALAAPPVTPAPPVRVVGQSSTAINLSVSGLGAGGGGPFDLVLGQSLNAGWKASVVGGGSLGAPVLIDGFANGWRIDPSTLGSALHHGTITVALAWKPQQRVDIALIISLVAIVVCLVLAFLPVRARRRRRRKGRHSPGGQPVSGSTVGLDPMVAESGLSPVPAGSLADGATETSPDETVLERSEDSDGPRLVVPFRSEAPRAPVWLALLAGVVVGVVAGLITSLGAGVAVGVAVAVVLLVPALRFMLGLLAVAGVVAAGVYVAVHQGQDHVPAGGSWPLSFTSASKLAWAGVVFLGADGAVEMIQRGSSALRRRASGGPQAPSSSETSEAGELSGEDHPPVVDPGDGPEVMPVV